MSPAGNACIGSIVEAGPQRVPRAADRSIGALARSTGVYQTSVHRALVREDPSRTPPTPASTVMSGASRRCVGPGSSSGKAPDW
jgi:hypothetical protein